MANHLPPETLNKMKALRNEGATMRSISRLLGISTNTVRKYISSDDGQTCDCGLPVGHKGWCKERYSKSIARQAFQASRRGVNIIVPPSPKYSRVSDAVALKRRWLGLDDGFFKPLPRDERYGAIGEVMHVTRKCSLQVREDVRQEMILRVFEGRVPRKDIRRAYLTFYGYFMRGMVLRTYEIDPSSSLYEYIFDPRRGLAA